MPCPAIDCTAYPHGYRDGFTTGTEIGAARILLALQGALGGELPELLPALPYAGTYVRLCAIRDQVPDRPCPRHCRRCSRCICAEDRARNLTRYGSPDYPGTDARRVARREAA